MGDAGPCRRGAVAVESAAARDPPATSKLQPNRPIQISLVSQPLPRPRLRPTRARCSLHPAPLATRLPRPQRARRRTQRRAPACLRRRHKYGAQLPAAAALDCPRYGTLRRRRAMSEPCAVPTLFSSSSRATACLLPSCSLSISQPLSPPFLPALHSSDARRHRHSRLWDVSALVFRADYYLEAHDRAT